MGNATCAGNRSCIRDRNSSRDEKSCMESGMQPSLRKIKKIFIKKGRKASRKDLRKIFDYFKENEEEYLTRVDVIRLQLHRISFFQADATERDLDQHTKDKIAAKAARLMEQPHLLNQSLDISGDEADNPLRLDLFSIVNFGNGNERRPSFNSLSQPDGMMPTGTIDWEEFNALAPNTVLVSPFETILLEHARSQNSRDGSYDAKLMNLKNCGFSDPCEGNWETGPDMDSLKPTEIKQRLLAIVKPNGLRGWLLPSDSKSGIMTIECPFGICYAHKSNVDVAFMETGDTSTAHLQQRLFYAKVATGVLDDKDVEALGEDEMLILLPWLLTIRSLAYPVRKRILSSRRLLRRAWWLRAAEFDMAPSHMRFYEKYTAPKGSTNAYTFFVQKMQAKTVQKGDAFLQTGVFCPIWPEEEVSKVTIMRQFAIVKIASGMFQGLRRTKHWSSQNKMQRWLLRALDLGCTDLDAQTHLNDLIEMGVASWKKSLKNILHGINLERVTTSKAPRRPSAVYTMHSSLGDIDDTVETQENEESS
eukprot:jgi/Bigna1/85472/estExt_fgenesh1_pg.C_40166